MLASWPGLCSHRLWLIADGMQWNVPAVRSHEKVEEGGEEYFRECARFENWVVAVLFKHFLVSEGVFSMAQTNVTVLTFGRPECIQIALFNNIPLYSKFLPLWKHFLLSNYFKKGKWDKINALLTFMVTLCV